MNQSQHNVYLFFGVVGAGKGTQVSLLEKFLAEKGEPTLHVYPGHEFRALLQGNESFTQVQVQKTFNTGILQPNFLVDTLTTNVLMKSYTGKEHLIFDGYPRKTRQAAAFEEMRLFYGWNSPTIIFIDISKEEAFTRLQKRGRGDDTLPGITKRIEEYKNNVLPALEQLKATGAYDLLEINGEQSIEQVHQDILKKLGFQ